MLATTQSYIPGKPKAPAWGSNGNATLKETDMATALQKLTEKIQAQFPAMKVELNRRGISIDATKPFSEEEREVLAAIGCEMHSIVSAWLPCNASTDELSQEMQSFLALSEKIEEEQAEKVPSHMLAKDEAEIEIAAYWNQYPHEQAMVELRDTIRSLNDGGDWWAELAHDEQGYYVLVNEIAGEDREYPVRSAAEFAALCEQLAGLA